jgi:hypothetical protein
MTQDQLREALRELNGERHVYFTMVGVAETVSVSNAMLIPAEADHLVKVTDGRSVFIIDAERVAWVRIGLK